MHLEEMELNAVEENLENAVEMNGLASDNLSDEPVDFKPDIAALNAANSIEDAVDNTTTVKKKVLKKRRKKKAVVYASDDDLAVLGKLRVGEKIRNDCKEKNGKIRGRKAGKDASHKPMVTLDSKLLQGPYVFPQSSGDSFTVVNPSVKIGGEDATSSVSIRPNVVWPQQDQLSKAPWVCVICGRGPGHSPADLLGPLYGPYYIKANWLTKDDPSIPAGVLYESSGEGSSKQSVKSESKGKKKGSVDEVPRLTLAGEIWTHSDCILWCPGAVFDGVSMRMTEISEFIHLSFSRTCTICSLVGALLQCSFRNCTQSYHFLCASKHNCVFDTESYSILCEKHRNSKQT